MQQKQSDIDRGSGLSAAQGPARSHDNYAAGLEEQSAGQMCDDEVCAVPQNNTAGARKAWDREQARDWVTLTPAFVTFRAIDGLMVGSSFRKQMTKLPEARFPFLVDRASWTTVGSHAGEVSYVTRNKEVRVKVDQSESSMPMARLAPFVFAAPPFLDHDGFQGNPRDLQTNCHYQDKLGFVVDYHRQTLPICPVGGRALHYVRVRQFFKAVDVPHGSIIDLPSVHCYFCDMLRVNVVFSWNVFQFEWSVTAGFLLLNEVLCGVKARLFSHTLRMYNRRVTPEYICENCNGPVASAARELEALLDPLDKVTPVVGMDAQLIIGRGPDRLRRSWIKVTFKSVDGVRSAVVHEDLGKLAFPYFSVDIDSQAILAGDADAGPTDHSGPADPIVPHVAVSSGSTGGWCTSVLGQTVVGANLLRDGDTPDSDLAELQ